MLFPLTLLRQKEPFYQFKINKSFFLSCVHVTSGEQNFNLELNQDFQDIGGVARNENGKWRLFGATVEGSRISFSLTSEADDRMIRQDYEGRIKGNVIDGTVKLSGDVKETRLKWRASRTATNT
jgi:osmotically-inducible protein OsmY